MQKQLQMPNVFVAKLENQDLYKIKINDVIGGAFFLFADSNEETCFVCYPDKNGKALLDAYNLNARKKEILTSASLSSAKLSSIGCGYWRNSPTFHNDHIKLEIGNYSILIDVENIPREALVNTSYRLRTFHPSGIIFSQIGVPVQCGKKYNTSKTLIWTKDKKLYTLPDDNFLQPVFTDDPIGVFRECLRFSSARTLEGNDFFGVYTGKWVFFDFKSKSISNIYISATAEILDVCNGIVLAKENNTLYISQMQKEGMLQPKTFEQWHKYWTPIIHDQNVSRIKWAFLFPSSSKK